MIKTEDGLTAVLYVHPDGTVDVTGERRFVAPEIHTNVVRLDDVVAEIHCAVREGAWGPELEELSDTIQSISLSRWMRALSQGLSRCGFDSRALKGERVMFQEIPKPNDEEQDR